jgi:hypothetical protein
MALFVGGQGDVEVKTQGSEGNELPKIEGIDTSTVSYMFDLATQTPNGMKRCLIERHSSTQPRGLFSIRFGVIGSDDGSDYSRLWAQRHILAKTSFYVISAEFSDMGKTRTTRSNFFLGKLKKKHNSRLFEGISDIGGQGDRSPIVAIVYEHERIQRDRKMEVGIPITVPANELMTEFSKIRHEGCQNHSTCSHIKFFHQRNDDPEYMASSASLNDFVIHEVAYALVPSPKNFQLILSTPFRSQYHEKNESVAPGEEHPEQKPVFDVEGENNYYLQFGKLEDNLYSCIYQPPFNLLQVFMIALSRFETQQSY